MAVDYSPLYGTDAADKLTPTYDIVGDVVTLHTTIYGRDGDDVITGNDEPLQKTRHAFYGEGGDDILKYSNSSVRAYFSGGVGDDVIHVTGKLQTATGGEGYDTLHATNITISEKTTAGFEALVLQGDIVFDDLNLGDFENVLVKWADITLSAQVDLSKTNIETTKETRLSIHGSDFADRFDASSYLGHMEIYSRAGDDVIIGNNSRMIANGGAGSDTLIGGTGADSLMAGGGDDAQTDKISGGGGNDILYYYSGRAIIDGGDGVDTLVLLPEIKKKQTFDLTVVDFTDLERLELTFLDSRLYLGKADMSEIRSFVGDANILMGGKSALTDISASGDLTITGSAKADEVSIISNPTGYIRFEGEAGNDIATISVSGSLSGGDGDDRLTGGKEGSRFWGGAGNDTIIAGNGDDDIHIDQTTGRSRDIVSGGGGEDTIAFDGAAQGHGRISGGGGADLLDCKGDISGYSIANVETLKLRGALTATAAALNGFTSIESFALNDKVDLTLDKGGAFDWKQGAADIWGKITGSRQADILEFAEANGDWTFDLGKGDDVATFGLGHDTFVYEAGGGHDVIHEFATWGSDSIRIARTSEIQSFQDLKERMMLRGDSLLIILDDDFSGSMEDMRDVIEITDMKAHHLRSGSFHFFDI